MLAIFVLSVQSVVAQNIFKAVVKDGDTKEVLVGVNAIVEKTTYGASSDANGTIIIKDIPDGVQRIKFSYLGYETETKSFTFPLASATPVEIFLEHICNLQEIHFYRFVTDLLLFCNHFPIENFIALSSRF